MAEFKAAVANADAVPVVRSIFDFSAEALGELKTWLEASGLAIPVTQIIGYQQAQQSVSVTNTGNVSIPNILLTTMTWDTTTYDLPAPGGQHSTTSNTSRLTCIVAGRYLPAASISFATSAAGTIREILIAKNGTNLTQSLTLTPLGGGNPTNLAAAFAPIDLIVGDYLEVRVDQDSGGALNVRGANSNFSMARIA